MFETWLARVHPDDRPQLLARVQALILQQACAARELLEPMQASLVPLLTAIAGLTDQLAAIDKALAQVARADAVAHRMCTAPGNWRVQERA